MSPAHTAAAPPAGLGTWLDEAVLVGDRLLGAIEGLDPAGLPGLRSSACFGHGVGGVAVFLSALARSSGAERFRTAAEALATWLLQAPPPASGGWMSGPAGAAYALWRTGRALNDAALAEEGARRLLAAAAGPLPHADAYDGACGVALLLVDAFHGTGEGRFHAAALEAGDAVLARVAADPAGVHLEPAELSAIPQTGAAHGASGLALALLALASIDGDAAWPYAARAALAHEDAGFRDGEGSWVDGRLRRDPRLASPEELCAGYARDRFAGLDLLPAAHPVAWCNGASGFVAARLWAGALAPSGVGGDRDRWLMHDLWRLPAAAQENFTYCCGMAAVAEVYAAASALGARPDGAALAEAVGARCAGRRVATGSWLAAWQCTSGRSYHGLLKGMAGVGYLFLHLHDPASVPALMTPGLRRDAPPPPPGGGRERLDALRMRLLGGYAGPALRGELETHVRAAPAADFAVDAAFLAGRLEARAAGSDAARLELARWRRDGERRGRLGTVAVALYFAGVGADALQRAVLRASPRLEAAPQPDGSVLVLAETVRGARVLSLRGVVAAALLRVIGASHALPVRALAEELGGAAAEAARQLLRAGLVVEAEA